MPEKLGGIVLPPSRRLADRTGVAAGAPIRAHPGASAVNPRKSDGAITSVLYGFGQRDGKAEIASPGKPGELSAQWRTPHFKRAGTSVHKGSNRPLQDSEILTSGKRPALTGGRKTDSRSPARP